MAIFSNNVSAIQSCLEWQKTKPIDTIFGITVIQMPAMKKVSSNGRMEEHHHHHWEDGRYTIRDLVKLTARTLMKETHVMVGRWTLCRQCWGRILSCRDAGAEVRSFSWQGLSGKKLLYILSINYWSPVIWIDHQRYFILTNSHDFACLLVANKKDDNRLWDDENILGDLTKSSGFRMTDDK